MDWKKIKRGSSPWLSEKAMATHSNTLAWRIAVDRGLWQATAHGAAKSQTRLTTEHSTAQCVRDRDERKGS